LQAKQSTLLMLHRSIGNPRLLITLAVQQQAHPRTQVPLPTPAAVPAHQPYSIKSYHSFNTDKSSAPCHPTAGAAAASYAKAKSNAGGGDGCLASAQPHCAAPARRSQSLPHVTSNCKTTAIESEAEIPPSSAMHRDQQRINYWLNVLKQSELMQILFSIDVSPPGENASFCHWCFCH
jgi:hypothetical protein